MVVREAHWVEGTGRLRLSEKRARAAADAVWEVYRLRRSQSLITPQLPHPFAPRHRPMALVKTSASGRQPLSVPQRTPPALCKAACREIRRLPAQ